MQCYGRFDNTEWAGLRLVQRAGMVQNNKACSFSTDRIIHVYIVLLCIVLFTTLRGIMLLLLATRNTCV